jgi:RHS repeat-associated protein
LYDAQGDIIALVSSTGKVERTFGYGPYGENTNTSGTVAYSTTNDPFLFQGCYHLAGGNAGTGNVPNDLYHYGARYYDPTTGRWTQPDQASGMTNFTFAGAQKANPGPDEFGEFAIKCAWGSGGYLGVAKVVDVVEVSVAGAVATCW